MAWDKPASGMNFAVHFAGLACAAAAFLLGRLLHRLVLAQGADHAGAGMMLIAAATFLSASAAVTLLALGRHVFDRVPLGPRRAPPERFDPEDD